jgi:hypothetical protein
MINLQQIFSDNSLDLPQSVPTFPLGPLLAEKLIMVEAVAPKFGIQFENE